MWRVVHPQNWIHFHQRLGDYAAFNDISKTCFYHDLLPQDCVYCKCDCCFYSEYNSGRKEVAALPLVVRGRKGSQGIAMAQVIAMQSVITLLVLIKLNADGLIKVPSKLPGHLLPPNVSGS